MVEKAVRKTTVKKTPIKVVAKKAASKTVSSTRTTPKTTTTRKAPTPVATDRSNKRATSQRVAVGVSVFVVFLGISAVIGMSDAGQISVESTITERKQSASPEEKARIESIPVQQSQNALPNGGLLPSGVPVNVPAPEPESVASSTEPSATSTEPVASSTDAVSAEPDTTPEESEEVSVSEEEVLQ